MGFFGLGDDGWEEDYLSGKDDGPCFPCSAATEERSEREIRLRTAKDIASGISMGTFERDEKIWELVSRLKEEK